MAKVKGQGRQRKAVARELPHIQAALLCQQFLEEKDGVFSIIRMVDCFTVHHPEPREGEQAVLELRAFIAFKAGPVTGERTLGLFWTFPTGKKGLVKEIPLQFAGDEKGVVVRLHFNLAVVAEGLYWCDVLIDGTPVTRIPARIVYEATAQPGQPLPNGQTGPHEPPG